MQKYQSHKVVEAAKITRMGNGFDADDEPCFDVTTAPDGVVISMPVDWGERIHKAWSDHHGREGINDTGYLVKYEGGYISWSPSKAFEEGYTEITPAQSIAEHGLMIRPSLMDTLAPIYRH